MEIVNIPKERVGTLVGEDGKTKAFIEKKAGVSISVTNEGEVTVDGPEDRVYFAKDIVKAIGRGFKPNTAMRLLKEDNVLEIINLKDYFNTDNSITRVKARIIGEEGRIKKDIEAATDTKLAIYGRTVSAIGPLMTINYAMEAIHMLMEGSMHSTVLNYLSKARKEIFRSKLG